jgi:hypothetical protein
MTVTGPGSGADALGPAHPGVRRRAAPLIRYRRFFVFASLLGAVIGLVALLPVRIVTTSVVSEVPTLQPGSVFEQTQAWHPSLVDLRVRTTAPGTISLLRPREPFGLSMPTEWIETSGWLLNSDATAYTADGPNAELSLLGEFSTLDLTFETSPNSPVVEVMINGHASLVDPAIGGSGVLAYHIVSGEIIETKSQRFLFSSISTNTPEDCFRSEFYLVRTQVALQDACDGARISVSAVTILGLLGQAAISSFAPLLAILVFLSLSSLLGYAILRRISATPNAVFGVSSALAGASLIFAVLGFLNYFLPVRVLLPVVVIATVGAIVDIVRQRPPAWFEKGPVTAAAMVSALVVVGFALTGGTGIGLLQTDIYEYQRLAQLFWNEGAISSGSDFGNGMRLIDSTARSLIHGATFEGAASLLVVHGIGLALVGGATARVVAVRRPRLAVPAGLIAAFGGAMMSLFIEGFLSRSFMATFLVAGWCAAGTAIAMPERSRGEHRALLIAAGCAFGVAAAIVPMYLIPALVPAVLLVGAQGGLRQRLKPVLPLALSMALVSLPNLLWLRKPDVAAKYAANVNEIGKITVVPFHGRPTMFNMLLGAESAHVNPLSLMGVESTSLPAFVTTYLQYLNSNALLVASVIAIMLLGLFAWLPRSDAPEPMVRYCRSTWLALLLGFLLFLPLWSTQSYFVLMYLWTVAPLALVTILVRGAAARGSSGKAIIVVASILVLSNVVIGSVEMSRWAELPRSGFDTRWRFDVGPELSELREWSQATEPGTYAIRAMSSQLFLSDDGRVLANLVDQELINSDFDCIDCQRQQQTRSLVIPQIVSEPAASDIADYTVLLGGGHCAGETQLSTDRLSICKGTP